MGSEIKRAGRPRIYCEARQRFTIELSTRLVQAIEKARGTKSKTIFLEEVLSKVPEIAAQEEGQ